MSQKIAILGLGQMGGTCSADARRHRVTNFLLWIAPAPSGCAIVGGKLVTDAKTLCAIADIVILLLAREEDVESRRLSVPAGLAEGGRDGLIVADMGTFGVALKERIRDALAPSGTIMLDTPISGTPEAMEAGRAVIMLSGDESCLRVTCARCWKSWRRSAPMSGLLAME